MAVCRRTAEDQPVMQGVTYWPSAVRAFAPEAPGWGVACPDGQAPPNRLHVDDRRMVIRAPGAPAHAADLDGVIARQWVMGLGLEGTSAHVELRHTALVRPGAYVVWVDQITSPVFHRYTSAVMLAGTLAGHDRDVRRVVVEHHGVWVQVALAADYDAAVVSEREGVRVDLHLRGHNVRFLAAAFAGRSRDEVAACDVRVSEGPVLEVRTAHGCDRVLHSNSRRRSMWIGPYQTDARWAVLGHTGQLVLVEFNRLTGPGGRVLVDEPDTVAARTIDPGEPVAGGGPGGKP